MARKRPRARAPDRSESPGRKPPSSTRKGAIPRRRRAQLEHRVLPQAIVELARREPGRSARQLAERLSVDDVDFDAFLDDLLGLEKAGRLLRVPGKGWDLPGRTPFRVGILQLDRKGSGFLRSTLADEEDVYLSRRALRDAMNGDTVMVRLTAKGRRGRLREGRVVEVLERGKRLIRGTYWKAAKGGYVTPEDRRQPTDVYIPPEVGKGVSDGERVLVKLLEGAFGVHPHGEIVARCHDEGSLASDVEVIAAEFELPLEYPPEGVSVAEALPAVRDGDQWPRRTDLRDLLIFTIDPVEACDFDDAVSLEPLKGGRLRLGVHIADVSHYVRSGSELDRAAEERGTAVYLPGAVIPMLPERLANDLCSLRPQEDRLAKTVRLTFTSSGTLEGAEVFHSVIRSRRRFTYEEVQAILDWVESGRAGAHLPPDHPEYDKTLKGMARLRDRLRRERRRRGALYLDLPKIKLSLGPEGEVNGVDREERSGSNDLIEEFMLAANEAVARFCVEKGLPVVGRAHPPPDEEKIAELREFLSALGVEFRGGSDPRDLQRLVSQVRGDPLSPVVQLALLRSMGHAEYVPRTDLHFALATSCYCHFTSPIRRYPDLLVHQILDEHFSGALARGHRRREWENRLPGASEWVSCLERRAEEAERAMVQLRLIRYLTPFLGQEMAGWVASVHPFGFFVQVDGSPIEGLVHVATLGDDYYDYDREQRTLVGRRRGRAFRPGDGVRVVLSGLNPDAREISFRIAESTSTELNTG